MRLMMSVSGVRGIVGETMTPALAAELGCAFGSELHAGSVVVGRDSRPSGEMIGAALVSGLVSAGCRVIDLGVVSTPGTALMVRRLGADGGVVITASHNPIEWNGIKFLTGEGLAPPPERAEAVFERWKKRDFAIQSVDRLQAVTHDDSTHDRHVFTVLDHVAVPSIAAKKFTVVLDSVNGAGGAGGRRLLEALRCRLVQINAAPTGRFAHPPEPVEAHLTQLCGAVRQHEAAVGFAQDPDADRLAIVDERGRYIGEEYTLALAARQVFATRPGPAAANLSTSRLIDDLAAEAGCVVHRSAVGEANVVATMRAHQCVIGGEGNGGVIDPRVVYVRDSLASMALVLELMARTQKPLSELVDDMPRYAMIKEKLEVDRECIPQLLDVVRSRFANERMNDADGLRIDGPDGWVHVRASNTEPIVRIIAEARTPEAARGRIESIREMAVSISK